MTNKIDERLQQITASARTGLMAHVVVGYPTLDVTVALVKAMDDVDVDFVELQIPFSDPLADGPTIQRACEIALTNGTRVRDAFEVAGQLTRQVSMPLLFMAYFNTVCVYGVERFCEDAAKAGISGIIVPDAPLEAAEREGLLESCERHGLYNIITLAPTSTDERLRKNAAIAKGFVYCMSREGVTGTQQGIDPNLQQYLSRVRRFIPLPLAVGFGISNRERMQAVAPYADIAVVGSAIINVIAQAKQENITTDVQAFLRGISSRSDTGQKIS